MKAYIAGRDRKASESNPPRAAPYRVRLAFHPPPQQRHNHPAQPGESERTMYDKKTEDRALNRLYRDIETWQDRNKPKEKPQGAGGFALLLMALMVGLAVLVLLTGCNTLAGVGADIEAAARGTQDYLAEPERGYTGR